MSVILGKHQSGIYREFNRNGSGGVYTGNEAQAASGQRRPDNKPGPKTDDDALISGITALFKKDLPPDQISGRLRAKYPGRAEKQASTSTIYKHIYQETAGGPIAQNKRAGTLNKAAIRTFRGIPAEARKTLTLDNGKEFAAHGSLSEALSIDIVFAHPYHSWGGSLTNIPTGSSDSTFLKKYRLIR
jgi:IS30 family transposase